MADDSFRKPKKIEFENPDQDPYNPKEDDEKPLSEEFEEQDDTQSTAAIVVEEYSRTIEFMKFVEQLIRDQSKVEVEIDPEDDPEVWMAMQRIFANPAPKLNQDSYFQVVDALEAIERIEQVEDREDQDALPDIPDTREVEEGEIKEEDFQISAIDEIEEKAKVRRSSAFKDPPPPPPPPKPPEPHPWLRRWRKYYRKIYILGRPYKVQWLRNRWWRDRWDRNRRM
jgi:hypothetical protein